MEIKNFIRVYDGALPLNVLGNLIRFTSKCDFKESSVGAGEYTVNFNIRKAYVFPIANTNKSLTAVHWFNILHHYFNAGLKRYKNDANILDYGVDRIINIDLLKYENTGFYTWHVDHFADIPRTMSCILLLNNDYEGGNLCFRNPDGSGEFEVDVKPNRMIIWPSNFLFPHTVKPVTNGTRYSVVAWAL